MPRSLILWISLFLILIFGVLILWPKYEDLRSIKIEVERKQKELQYGKEYISGFLNLKERLKEYQNEILKIEDSLPFELSLPCLFSFFQKASSENGVILTALSWSEPSAFGKNSRIKQTIFNISVSGSYQSFKQFLSYLEKSAKFFGIQNIAFSSDEEPFNFDIKVRTFSY